MRFHLVDAILQRTDEQIVTWKHVTSGEEYLQDHFPGFPVLPGVLMVESLVQAARELLVPRLGASAQGLVLASARAIKFGHFLRPGWTLQAEVRLRASTDGAFTFEGRGLALAPAAPPELAPWAVSGRFTLRSPRRPEPTG